MNLCIVSHRFPQRSQTFVREHAVGMARRGHATHVLSARVGDNISRCELDALDGEGVHRRTIPRMNSGTPADLIHVPSILLRDPRRIRCLLRKRPWSCREVLRALEFDQQIQQIDPDVVHVHFGGTAAPLLRANVKRSLVVTWHGYDVVRTPRQRGSAIYSELFASRALHTTNSNFLKRRLVALGADPERVWVVPMGVDLLRFPYRPRATAVPGQLRILSVGRLVEVKGHAYLIDAVARLRLIGITARLEIIGDGPLRRALQERIRGHGIADRVALLGAQTSDAVVSAMNRADVFVLPSIEALDGSVEAQGLVLAEAQASGLPVIASRSGGVPESLQDGATGLLCSPANADALVNAIATLERDPGLRNRFALQGRRFVEERFGCQTMLDSFDTVYSNLP